MKLERSENGWKRFGSEQKLRKAQGILNKLTNKTFDKLSVELLRLGVELPESSMNVFVTQIFETAVSDASLFSDMYADLCHMLASTPSVKKPLLPQFRKLLLNHCQKEFEKDRPDPQDEKERLEAMEATGLEEEQEYKLIKDRQRMFGNIKLIGELFLCTMVSGMGG